MALINFENLPSENTPLTGGASGNLNVMQENGTTHGSDTKLGYSQAFLNDHIVNISNEVDEDYRVNFIYGNLFDNSTDGSPDGTYLKADGTTGIGDSNLRITDYIPIDATKGNLIVSGITSTMSTPALCFYDSSKTFISGVSYGGATEKTFVIPSNASYFKTSYRTTIVSTFFIKYPPSIYVDNEEIYNKNKVEPILWWTNPTPTSSFSGQAISIPNFTSYKYFEIIYREDTTTTYNYSSGRLPIGSTRLILPRQVNYVRNVIGGANGITFGEGQYYGTYANTTLTTNNNWIIPYMILLYK